ncbi:hypothetical protein GMJLKIPL_1939 [Methylobacterium isbiliense]|jgi:hypothetical protein|uniref:Phage tail protein n=1 Tax=Methylobacterium isbiliense TaxID=315478 RepID=A0ABQ4SEB3_9HYPH|nr:hypothetical protein GMJLKIPL_1939 [Methylobacterium isbiliense]
MATLGLSLAEAMAMDWGELADWWGEAETLRGR